MDESTRRKIYNIAYRIRREIEVIQQNNTKDFPWKDLCGLCAIGSGKLFKALKKAGIKTKICFAEFHTYLMYEDYYVIDITATQFDCKNKVLIIEKSKVDRNYIIEKTFTSFSAARQFQIDSYWDDSQIMY